MADKRYRSRDGGCNGRRLVLVEVALIMCPSPKSKPLNFECGRLNKVDPGLKWLVFSCWTQRQRPNLPQVLGGHDTEAVSVIWKMTGSRAGGGVACPHPRVSTGARETRPRVTRQEARPSSGGHEEEMPEMPK
ncbi:hypothetical protein INR49_026970 [Caranx melampygus]|nr:hypothetical protein INR49_026970 [Caranx melampygus]